jgi:hypothetical protein
MRKNPHAVALGKLGGDARAKKLSKKERREGAKKAVLARIAKYSQKRSGTIPLDTIPDSDVS